MKIREATLEDNDELIELQAQCPQGTTIIVSTVNTPDFFARAKVYENYKVFVVCEDNRIIASAACGLRRALINDKIEKIGHEFQAFVHPSYRGRRIAGQLHRAREEYLKQQGAALSYGLIMEGNKPSIRHVQRQGFKHHRAFIMPVIAVYKEIPITYEGTIRTMTSDDVREIAELLNLTWQGYEFYEPMSEEELKNLTKRTPGYDYDSIFILEEYGEIKACLGFWDWSKVTQVTVKALSLRMRALTLMLDTARLFTPVPHPPRPGELLRQIILTPIGFKDINHITTLLKHVNNLAYSEGIEQIFFVCDRGHPLKSNLRGFIHIDTGMNIYIKPLSEDILPGNQPVFISGLDM